MLRAGRTYSACLATIFAAVLLTIGLIRDASAQSPQTYDPNELFGRSASPSTDLDDGARPFPSSGTRSSPTAASTAPRSVPVQSTPTVAPLGTTGSLFDEPQGGTTPASGVIRADARSGQLSQEIRQLSSSSSARRVSANDILGQPIAEIRIIGNKSIPTYAIERMITETRVGRPVISEQILKDKTRLVNTRWFLSVRDRVELTNAGPAVVFEVIEAPILRRVEFVGNSEGYFSSFTDEKLARETGLVPGHGFDVAANLESVQRIKQLYREKGYLHAKVELKKGGHRDDREVVIVIDEGPKVAVSWISFTGNRFVSGPVLKTKLSTKSQWFLMFGGKYNPELIQNDIVALKSYYEGLGFFDVDVRAKESVSRDKSRVHVTFHIKEGPRYKIRNVELAGNSVLGRQQLLRDLKLKPGDPFNARFLQQDAQGMKDQYDQLGRPFASVQPVPRFLPEAGWLDLVYDVDEDKVCRIGRINVRIRGDETHTRTSAVRHRINRYLKPGELAKAKDIQSARTIVATDPIFDREDPPNFEIRRVSGEDYLAQGPIARGQDVTAAFTGGGGLRPASMVLEEGFQGDQTSPLWKAPGVETWFGPRHPNRSPQRAPQIQQTDTTGRDRPAGQVSNPSAPMETTQAPASSGQAGSLSYGGEPMAYLPPSRRTRRDAEEPATVEPALATSQPALNPTVLFNEIAARRAVEQSAVYRGQSLDGRGLPNPQNYMYDDGNQGDPFGNAVRGPAPDFVDIDIDVTEGRTGRLMFGAGINSNAGVVGNLVLQEDNFDILAWPRGWADFRHGRAFRGGGQSFRIEAVPGTEVSRYTASWRTPYFLGTDFSFGVDGFYYNRFFENWTEDRLGGRLSLGYIINRHWTAGVNLRLENVEFRDFLNVPATPQLYRDVAGDNFLSTVQLRIARDTRDSPFLPSRGNLVEFAYEQAFGEFSYPRFDLTLSQFFTVWERADGTGKHTLQLRGETVWTGDDTPVFERLYAGGFQSFRGFQFRGVTPRESSFRIGGQFMALGHGRVPVPDHRRGRHPRRAVLRFRYGRHRRLV